MASTYALPVSAMPLSHGHGQSHSHNHVHVHGHSRSHSPSFVPSKLGPGGQKAANTSRTLRQERSNGGLHAHTRSQSPHDRKLLDAQAHRLGHLMAPPELLSRPGRHGVRPEGGAGEMFTYDGSPASLPWNGHESSPLGSLQSHRAHDHAHHHHDHDHDHDHDHAHHDHSHHDHSNRGHTHKPAQKPSRFTRFILPYTEQWSLLHSILIEKDPRRIFYFMALNFSFMAVQAFYGFATDSLGLLSDSIHMFFDCLALALGLFAAVSSKWPASERFPYGFGMIESLSGFGNGVFLMLISIEILIEAIERLAEGRETKRLTELLVVSSLGLAVNLVGMACFGHHHHGHNHSHGGHSHGHSHGHDHDHSHADGATDGACNHDHAEPHSKGHDHENENMRGIFLHVLADTMGSAAVIISTLLIQYVGWSGWDPLASCIIAVLIFLSSIPLVISSAKKLLLTVPADTEYQLRNTLAGVSDLRGVASYSVPRFWMADGGEKEGEGVLGVMHIVVSRGADLDDVRDRARGYLSSHGMDVVLQVEREGGSCWCGGSNKTPASSTSRFS